MREQQQDFIKAVIDCQDLESLLKLHLEVNSIEPRFFDGSTMPFSPSSGYRSAIMDLIDVKRKQLK